MPTHSIILGCGVSGLSTAIRFLEADPGNTAEIWARDLPPSTTSNVAAAIWYPYLARPVERVLGWGKRTLDALYDLADEPGAGIAITEAVELFRHEPAEPWWRSSVRQFRMLEGSECPPSYAGGYRFETIVVETSLYLPYLMRRFVALGGVIHQREVNTLQVATSAAPVVFNCTGLGSYTLLDDKEMYPVRGQVLRTTKPASTLSMLDDEEEEDGVFAYIVPRSQDCILGGTAIAGDWTLDSIDHTGERILERCARMNPEVLGLTVLESRVGLRPGRSAVRLEREQEEWAGGVLVHNYGHGGAGITLSWGCAEEAVGLAGLT